MLAEPHHIQKRNQRHKLIEWHQVNMQSTTPPLASFCSFPTPAFQGHSCLDLVVDDCGWCWRLCCCLLLWLWWLRIGIVDVDIDRWLLHNDWLLVLLWWRRWSVYHWLDYLCWRWWGWLHNDWMHDCVMSFDSRLLVDVSNIPSCRHRRDRYGTRNRCLTGSDGAPCRNKGTCHDKRRREQVATIESDSYQANDVQESRKKRGDGW